MRPSIREVCHGSERRECQHTGSNLPYLLWKGVNQFELLAKDLN